MPCRSGSSAASCARARCSTIPTLVRLGSEVGIPADEIRDVLAGNRYAAEVQADIDEARALGINGVPFFVIDRRYGISGAQSSEMFLGALTQAHAEAAGSRS
jgi:predicted DsbA family dithiol-disulfide isomerase